MHTKNSDKSEIHRLSVTAITAPLTSREDERVQDAARHVLVVDDGSVLVEPLLTALQQRGWRVLVLSEGVSLGAVTVTANWSAVSSVEALVARLKSVAGGLEGIFFLSTHVLDFDKNWVSAALGRLRSAIAVARGVSLTNEQPLGFLYFVTGQGGRFGLERGASPDALAVGLEGLAHPLRMEMPKTAFRSIDLDLKASLEESAHQLVKEISEPEVPYRTAYGWKRGTRATLSVRAVSAPEAPLDLEAGSVVVMAGGARGIGAVCAKALAERLPCRVVFLGRTPLAPEAETLARLEAPARQAYADQFMREYKAANPGCTPREPREAWRRKLQAIQTVETLEAIRALGSEAFYYAVDVRDRQAVAAIFAEVKARFGRLDVAVHVAGLGGVDTDRMLVRKEWSVIDQVLETKVTGAMHILAAAEAAAVPLFIGFGSIASRFGNSGQVDYASANGLLAGIARAHNARGVQPVARVLAWGAWDGVGMAVSGPTKDALMAYGVRFITPESGGECFVRELTTRLDAAHPAELYVSPSWTGLTDLLAQPQTPLEAEEPQIALEAAKPQASLEAEQPLMGAVVERREGEYLRAERWLDARAIPFLDHHRYDGTAWVPAVVGMEVACQVAASLYPGLTPFALRDVALKKAVRLVRDEPVLLIGEARFSQQSGDETIVEVTISARYKERTWIFAEMKVVLSAVPERQQAGLVNGLEYHGSTPLGEEPGELIVQDRQCLYPSEWLRFQTSGPTFQVIESMAMNCSVGRTEGRMASTADLQGCYSPLTFIDGVFQAYGVTLCTILQSWAGPPLYIGEIRWRPGSASVRKATFKIRVNLEDKANYPVLHMFDEHGECMLRMQRAEQGGTSLKELAARQAKPVSLPTISTPYLGDVLEQVPGQRVRAERLLDPKQDVLLRDHQFYIFVVVPAVYFMEAAVEAAALAQPGLPPCEIRDFEILQALHLLKDTQVLVTEAEVLEAGVTRVQLYSRRGADKKVHATGTILHGPSQPLGRAPEWPLEAVQSRTGEGLYPHRFPNGPIFQVIEKMELGHGYRSRSQLRLNGDVAAERLLPITLLDGAFQVDSATRSGYDRPSGLPRRFGSLRWTPAAVHAESVQCLSVTGDASPESPGDLLFVNNRLDVVLCMTGIALTAALPTTIGSRSKS